MPNERKGLTVRGWLRKGSSKEVNVRERMFYTKKKYHATAWTRAVFKDYWYGRRRPRGLGDAAQAGTVPYIVVPVFSCRWCSELSITAQSLQPIGAAASEPATAPLSAANRAHLAASAAPQ